MLYIVYFLIQSTVCNQYINYKEIMLKLFVNIFWTFLNFIY